MKILIVNTLYYPNMVGGAERSVQFLAEKLVEQGHEVAVLCLNKEEKTDVIHGVQILYVKLRNIYWPFDIQKKNLCEKFFWHFIDMNNIFMIKNFENVIREFQPDVIHSNNLSGFSTIIWRAAKQHDIPIVHTIRDYYLLCSKSTMYSKERNCGERCLTCRCFTYQNKKLSKAVDAVVGVSQFVLDIHLKFGLFQNAQKAVIYNPYDPIHMPKKNKTSKLIVGYIGALSQHKGIGLLIDDFLKINDRNCRLYIAGKGNKEFVNELKCKATDTRIEFKGFVKPAEFYSQIDVLVVPSLWHEPLGRIVYEAYSHGIPVISSKRGGDTEIVEIGKNGCLFEPEEADSLKVCIEMFLENKFDLEAMSQFCLEYSKKFRSQIIVPQYVDLYKNVIGKN